MYRFCRSESGFWHARLPPRLPSGPGRPRIGPPAAYPLFASGLNADLPPVVARADYSPLRPARLPSSSPSPLTPPTVKPNPSTSLLDLCPIGNSFPSSSRPTDVTICATQLLKVRRLYVQHHRPCRILPEIANNVAATRPPAPAGRCGSRPMAAGCVYFLRPAAHEVYDLPSPS